MNRHDAMKATPQTTPTPATQLLADWGNGQDHWVRAIVSEALATRSELSDAAIQAAYDLFLREKQLATEGDVPNVPLLQVADVAEVAAEALRFTRISEIGGVNALAAKQAISFNPKMTLLFGENASGKTGYVRMFKRLASVRSAEPILGNIRKTSGGEKPHAKIEFALGDVAQTMDWKDEVGIPPFTRMSVFDSRAVSVHVDDDLTYVFTPGDLALFRHVHQAIEGVKARLERDKGERVPKGNPFLPRFVRDASIYPKIEALGPTTDVGELERLAAGAPSETDLQTLRQTVEALRPQAIDTKIRVVSADRELYASLAKTADTIGAFDWTGYNACVERVRLAAERHAAARETSFSADALPGALGDAWNAFIHAGEAYLVDTKRGQEYPVAGDQCLYCRQDLGAAAVALLAKYREYCNNEYKTELEASRADLLRRSAPLVGIGVKALSLSVLRRKESHADATAIPAALGAAAAFLHEAEIMQQGVNGGSVYTEQTLVALATTAAANCHAEVKKADDLLSKLRAQATEREASFSIESARLALWQNQIVLRTLLPDIRTYVEGAKWASRAADLISKRFPPILRSLTGQSTLASEQLLNQDFERLFIAECLTLRAPTVTLDFSGRKGQAARRKVLAPEHRLSAILSEGEQKVIALADFLAEAFLRRASAPIVFDDPVNSLDYKRLEYVVDRIIKLSETRQVVVFTHNIWFAAEILARFEKKKEDCSFFNVLEQDGDIGIVVQGSGPRWDTTKSIAGRINVLVQAAAKETGEVRAALVEKGYSILRSYCEAFVEQDLLFSVTRRYQPNVMMTKLPDIKLDRFAAARDAVLPVFDKACRMIAAHSQPLETLGVRPSLQDLEGDWKTVREAREVYVKS